MTNKPHTLIYFFCLFLLSSLVFAESEDESIWTNNLKNHYFFGQAIEESNDVIELEAPYRAEDPALVPLKIISKIDQSPNNYIKKIVVIVDKNPLPFVGEFVFSPESGKADLAMRIRVNTYSYIRAIAQMNDGRLFMSKKYVKASGGCSVPINADLDTAMKRLGKIKFKVDENVKPNQPNLVQLLISHPNITGMQIDQVSRFLKRSHFIENITVSFDGKPIMAAKTDIAISSDPNFRFYFVPKQKGILKAEFSDTSCENPISREICTKGQTYSEIYLVSP